jgi:AcrR family transcriptional regulator
MVSRSRARSDHAKAERRAEILAATLDLWQEQRYEVLTLQAVAQKVGLTKAALYGYYATKESLFLHLYETQVAEFLQQLHRHLNLGGIHTPASLGVLVGTLLAERPALTRLLPHLAGVLERNISEERAAEHKRWLLRQLVPVAALLEGRLPGLGPGGGVRLLTYTQALAAGLYPMADPAPAVTRALADPSLAPLCVTFVPALEDALVCLYAGLSTPHRGTPHGR